MSDTAVSEDKGLASKEQSPSDLECIEESNLYALYSLNSFPSSEACLKNEGDEKCDDSEDTGNYLSVVATNLRDELESEVRSFLLTKLSDKACLAVEGKYAVLCLRSNLGCYYHFLQKDAVQSDLSENTLLTNEKQVTCKYRYVVCFLGSADGTLESFSPEVARFCSSLQTSLNLGEDCIQKLDQWHTWAIQFICSCINLLKSDIAVILQLALCGNKMCIVCDDVKMKWNLERFLETCSLTSVLPIGSPTDYASLIKTSTESSSELWENMKTNDTVTVMIKDEKVIFDPAVNCSLHCQRWSESLLSNDQRNYSALKKTIDDFKLKTIQDLNILKRLLKKAENDHYSLFKAYQFLVKSGYKDILMQKAKQEALLSNNLETCELIILLMECC